MGSSLVLGWNQPSQAAGAQPARRSRCSAGVAREQHRSLLSGGVWEPQSCAVPPRLLHCHSPPSASGAGVASGQALRFPTPLWVSALGLRSGSVSPGSACTQYRREHSVAGLTASALNRGQGPAPSACRPHFLSWDSITLVCQRGTFLVSLYPFLPQK